MDSTQAATEAMTRCEAMAKRLEEGVEALEKNEAALEAFRFANRAMARQRVRSIYALGCRRGEKVTLAELDVVKNRSWRPFQLAFILLSIPALADPKHRDRTQPLEAFADLLWFPTGGGKTEAYLGVVAFTMAIRRLQGNLGGYDAGRGLAVIMRYTLRLLRVNLSNTERTGNAFSSLSKMPRLFLPDVTAANSCPKRSCEFAAEKRSWRWFPTPRL